MEDNNNEVEKTFDMRINHLRTEWDAKYNQKCEEFEKLLKNKNSFEEKLRDLQGKFKQLEVKNTKMSQDNYRMKYILIGNNTKIDAMRKDVEYYKFRVKEISDISEDEEDAIRKVLKKNAPK